jgi:hypothetical protein
MEPDQMRVLITGATGRVGQIANRKRVSVSWASYRKANTTAKISAVQRILAVFGSHNLLSMASPFTEL